MPIIFSYYKVFVFLINIYIELLEKKYNVEYVLIIFIFSRYILYDVSTFNMFQVTVICFIFILIS